MESSRNPVAAAAEKEAGWTLVSALLASMPKEVNRYFLVDWNFQSHILKYLC